MNKSQIVKKTNNLIDIINNKPLPEWIKNHQIFSKVKKFEKVFPHIGLSNFKQEVDIDKPLEVSSDARDLLNDIYAIFIDISNKAYQIQISNKEKEKYEALQRFRCVIASAASQLYNDQCIVDNNKKISLKIFNNVLDGNYKVVYKAGESIFGIYQKIKDEAEKYGLEVKQIEQLKSFKEFSKNNVNAKKYNIVFSSVGEEGLWDISTISMRGIKSCQTWDTPQSKQLIGTIISKFSGVIYLTSGKEINGMGSRMLKRCLVRFMVNAETKKPVLFLDKMYPADDPQIKELFVKTLNEKSKLDVIVPNQFNYSKYYIPTEESLKLLSVNELPYMDNPIYSKDKYVEMYCKKPSINETNIYNQCYSVIENYVYTFFNNAYVQQKTAKKNKTKYEGPIQKGSLNVLRYMAKHLAFGRLFVRTILCNYTRPLNKLAATEAEYKKMLLIDIISNLKKISRKAYKQLPSNKCKEKFPVSYKKMYNLICLKIKESCINQLKQTIKEQTK